LSRSSIAGGSCQRLAGAQHAEHLGEIVKGRPRSRIGRKVGAGALGAVEGGERAFQIFEGLALECSDDPLRFVQVPGGDQAIHLLGVVARHGRQMVLTDRFPDHRQRASGYLPGKRAIRRTVGEQRLQWLEEVTRGVADAIVGLAGIAEFRPQLRQDDVGRGNVCTACLQPLGLLKQTPAGLLREQLQILSNLIGLDFVLRHRRP
jgi:hypothetical protein